MNHLVESLSRVTCLGGNFLLNVGPKPDGTICAGEAQRMREIGCWLKTNGDAVYGTEGCPVETGHESVRATRKGRTVYVHLRQWPVANTLALPGIRTLPRRVRLLGSSARLAAKRGTHSPKPGQAPGIELRNLPPAAPDSLVQVIALSFGRSPALTLRRQARFNPPCIRLHARQDTVLGVQQAKSGGYGRKGQGLSVVNLSAKKGSTHEGGADCFTIWNFAEGQHLTWTVECSRAGRYAVYVETGIDPKWAGRSRFTICAAGQTLAGVTQPSPTDDDLKRFRVGAIRLARGKHTIRFRIEELCLSYMFGGHLRGVVLKPC